MARGDICGDAGTTVATVGGDCAEGTVVATEDVDHATGTVVATETEVAERVEADAVSQFACAGARLRNPTVGELAGLVALLVVVTLCCLFTDEDLCVGTLCCLVTAGDRCLGANISGGVSSFLISALSVCRSLSCSERDFNRIATIWLLDSTCCKRATQEV
mmetsp:Transcript_36864/g.66821  ORF Transcript_36864/g.66821 Transcript_36864/m.66821 type:complete len:161 (-) Transcript_36864:260-742(-)